jgi:hypothetical protein
LNNRSLRIGRQAKRLCFIGSDILINLIIKQSLVMIDIGPQLLKSLDKIIENK